MVESDDKGDGKKLNSNEFNVNNEISLVVDKGKLPPKIAEKIKEKIDENNLKINKEQFYKLIEKIQFLLKTYVKDQHSSNEKIKINNSLKDEKISKSVDDDSLDMQQLVKAVDNLRERIEDIEKKNLKDFEPTSEIRSSGQMELSKDALKPLEQISNDPESIVVSMKWLQYLVDKLGKINLPDILGYYVDINWITEDVRLDLMEYSKGITAKQDENNKKISNLSTKEHIQSLLFIQKLKRKHLDERFLWKIDREMEKMAKSIDNIQIK